MNNQEKHNLVRALMAASNAFHASLRESGYHVSYGLNDSRTGFIINDNSDDIVKWPVGQLTIKWELKNED